VLFILQIYGGQEEKQVGLVKWDDSNKRHDGGSDAIIIEDECHSQHLI
jgi:hypothetical protein